MEFVFYISLLRVILIVFSQKIRRVQEENHRHSLETDSRYPEHGDIHGTMQICFPKMQLRA